MYLCMQNFFSVWCYVVVSSSIILLHVMRGYLSETESCVRVKLFSDWSFSDARFVFGQFKKAFAFSYSWRDRITNDYFTSRDV